MPKPSFDSVAWIAALLFSGVAAGMFLLDFFGYYSVLPRLNPHTAIEVHQASLPIRRTIFQVVTVSSALSSLLLYVFFSEGVSRRLLVAQVLCFVALVIYTNAVLIPLNREIATWQPALPPHDWENVFSKMTFRERLRSFLPTVAFVLELIAFIVRKNGIANLS